MVGAHNSNPWVADRVDSGRLGSRRLGFGTKTELEPGCFHASVVLHHPEADRMWSIGYTRNIARFFQRVSYSRMAICLGTNVVILIRARSPANVAQSRKHEATVSLCTCLCTRHPLRPAELSSCSQHSIFASATFESVTCSVNLLSPAGRFRRNL